MVCVCDANLAYQKLIASLKFEFACKDTKKF